VNQAWAFLESVESADEVRYERKKAVVRAALEGFSDDEVITAVQARRNPASEGAGKTVKQAEIEVLASVQQEIGADKPDGQFFARALPKKNWDKPWMQKVERIVLVHRLREVSAQLGFTRFEANTPDVDGELQISVQPASLAREVTWLPAVENRGEGIFIQFNSEEIEQWRTAPGVRQREDRLRLGFAKWQEEHPNSRREFADVTYIMLHSLSHLLITAVSLECGYPASSIRERVYASETGYGILLYTGTPDAEGTLGGLVEAGRQIARHVRTALELGRLCSNDPVCAQHDPQSQHEQRFLQGAACHGCLLIAETSCEQFNDFLDRALVVPTVDGAKAGFMAADFL
jgi:hypothetical protein